MNILPQDARYRIHQHSAPKRGFYNYDPVNCTTAIRGVENSTSALCCFISTFHTESPTMRGVISQIHRWEIWGRLQFPFVLIYARMVSRDWAATTTAPLQAKKT